MASITWQGLTSFVQNQVAAVQASTTSVIDATRGSVTLAWAQASTGVALWLQAQIIQVLALTRAATSNGTDLDSFYADFNFFRLPPVAATTTETFGRFTATQQATIPAGTLVNGVPTGGYLVSTGPGGLQYMVMADAANGAYNATLGAYVVPVATASITVPIRAIVAGTGSNVLLGTIQSFVQAIPGIDFCTNPADVTNGLNAESDPAFRSRFPLYLASLATADESAIENAILGVQQGIKYLLIENFAYPGDTEDDGSFFAVIDDGTGTPPDSLLTMVDTAIGGVRGFTIRYQGAYAPTVVAPSITLDIRVVAGFVSPAVRDAVAAVVAAFVNSVPLNAETLFISQIETAAVAVPGCAGVKPNNTTIDAVTADFGLDLIEIPRITSGDVTVGTY